MSIDLHGAFENRAPFKPEAPLANHNAVKGITIEATDPFDKGSTGPNLAPLLFEDQAVVFKVFAIFIHEENFHFGN
jgi:hypothetical protein